MELKENKYEFLKTIGKSLTVLIAEDDQVTSLIAKKTLSTYFKKIILTKNGEEAYEKYIEHKPDLLITDNLMPKLNGIDLIKKIRENDDEIPIVLMTAHINTEEMIDYINLRVTQFLTKPFKKDMLLNAVETSIEKVAAKELSRKSNELMLENLKFKEQKHLYENESAFKKEINIIKNDLYYKYLSTNDEKWFFDIFYKPKEVLSGDSYTIRQIDENIIFVCSIDAMGKGLSASITSMSSASFLNYLVDSQKEDGFDLEQTIKKYFQYMKSLLLEEEIICVSFALFDFNKKRLNYSLFGAPPLLIKNIDDSLTKIKTNNLPISKFSQDCNIDEYELNKLDKILIYSDGLNESIIKNSKMYGDYLENDFSKSLNFKDFLNCVKNRIKNFDDDTTFFYINKFNKEDVQEKHTFTINSKQKNIDDIAFKVESLLDKNRFDEYNKLNFMYAFRELLMNAYEHGNLEVANYEKHNLIQENIYNQILEQREKKFKNRKIDINVSFKNDDIEKSITAIIEDEGKGFDTEVLKQRILNKNAFNGRGLLIAKKMLDGFYYNKIGNSVMIKKFQKKEKLC